MAESWGKKGVVGDDGVRGRGFGEVLSRSLIARDEMMR